jgi:hypothetical protein
MPHHVAARNNSARLAHAVGPDAEGGPFEDNFRREDFGLFRLTGWFFYFAAAGWLSQRVLF